MELNFKVKNQLLKRTDRQIVVNKSRNFHQCNFKFIGDDWEGLEKFAIFRNSKGKSYINFLGSQMECKCSIPAPAMIGNYMVLSVYGGDLLTSQELKIVLLPSGYTIDITPVNPEAKDIFEEAFEKIESKIDHIAFEEGYLRCYSSGVLLEETPIMVDLHEKIKELIPSFKLTDDGDLIINYKE